MINNDSSDADIIHIPLEIIVLLCEDHFNLFSTWVFLNFRRKFWILDFVYQPYHFEISRPIASILSLRYPIFFVTF